MDEAQRRFWAPVPHLLSFLRVVLVGVTYFAAARQDRALFGVLVLVAVLTDVLDGPIARASGTASRFGANVDSAADFVFYLSLPVWASLFDPTIVSANWPLIAIFLILYTSANIVSHYTFGAMGVHNRLSRASGTFGVVFTFYMILWGQQDLWFEQALYYALIVLLSADVAQRYGAVMMERRRRGAIRTR